MKFLSNMIVQFSVIQLKNERNGTFEILVSDCKCKQWHRALQRTELKSVRGGSCKHHRCFTKKSTRSHQSLYTYFEMLWFAWCTLYKSLDFKLYTATHKKPKCVWALSAEWDPGPSDDQYLEYVHVENESLLRLSARSLQHAESKVGIDGSRM